MAQAAAPKEVHHADDPHDVTSGTLRAIDDLLLTDDDQAPFDAMIGDDMAAIVDMMEENIGIKYKDVIEAELKDLSGCKSKKITWLHDDLDDTNNDNDKSEAKDEKKESDENKNKNRFEKRISRSKHFNYKNSDCLIELELENAKFKVFVGTDVMSTNQSGYYRLEPTKDGSSYLVMENEEGTKKFENLGYLLMGYDDTKELRKASTAKEIKKGLESANNDKK